MSVIAWDGKTIAADKSSTCCEMRAPVTKILRLKSGDVVAWTGGQEQGMALAEWYENGADRTTWPEFQKGDDWTRLIVASKAGVFEFERLPFPQKIESPFRAWGSGRDFAMGAMAMGADASTAVIVATTYNIHCGCGLDAFDIVEGND